MEIIPSSKPLDLKTMSRIKALEEVYSECGHEGVTNTLPSDSETTHLLADCAVQLQSKVNQLISECSDLSFLEIDDLGKMICNLQCYKMSHQVVFAYAFSEHLKGELSSVDAESAKISNEIEALTRNYIEDSGRLESDLEGMKISLDFISSEDLAKGRVDVREDQEMVKAFGGHDFEIFKLDDQIEKSKRVLDSLQDLETIFERLDAMEQIEDALSNLKVLDFDGTLIRLSLRTYIPKLEDLLYKQMVENISEPFEANHELLIEVTGRTMELKKVEIYPNDVCIADIIDVAKSFRQLYSRLALTEARPPLEWFVRKVQERIIYCTLRRSVVKSTNNLRHSFEYLDRDEMIVAHLVGGVDAFIKVSPGWPVISSPLTLTSLKSSDNHSMEIPLSHLFTVEEAANSLGAAHLRQNLSSFVDAIEKFIVEQTRIESY